MIVGIGVDIVAVDRFNKWTAYSLDQLCKIFTLQELADSKDEQGVLIAEKLATRFAAKEAFYKALSAALVEWQLTEKQFGLLSLCRYVSVVYSEWKTPLLHVTWESIVALIGPLPLQVTMHLSLSHEKATAIAFVVLSAGLPVQNT